MHGNHFWQKLFKFFVTTMFFMYNIKANEIEFYNNSKAEDNIKPKLIICCQAYKQFNTIKNSTDDDINKENSTRLLSNNFTEFCDSIKMNKVNETKYIKNKPNQIKNTTGSFHKVEQFQWQITPSDNICVIYIKAYCKDPKVLISQFFKQCCKDESNMPKKHNKNKKAKHKKYHNKHNKKSNRKNKNHITRRNAISVSTMKFQKDFLKKSLKLPDSNDCRVYYLSKNNHFHRRLCPERETFDHINKKCTTDPNNIFCRQQLVYRPFVHDKSSEAIIRMLGELLQHSGSHITRSWRQRRMSNKKVSHQFKNENFACRNTGRFKDPADNEFYYICTKVNQQFISHRMQCPFNTYFMESEQMCKP